MFKFGRILITLSLALMLGIIGSVSLAQDGLDPFQASVDDGSLPPLAERLPTTPLVVESGVLLTEADLPDWQAGVHGGTLRTAFTSAFGLSGEF